MGTVICIRTRKKWKRPARTSGNGPAKFAAGGEIRCPGGSEFTSVGVIADRVVRQLRTR